MDSHTLPGEVEVAVDRIDYGHVDHDSVARPPKLVNSTVGCDRWEDMAVACGRLPSVRVCLY